MSTYQDLEWLAQNVKEWKYDDCDLIRMDESDKSPVWSESGRHVLARDRYFTKNQWLQARRELGLELSGISEEDEEAAIQEHYERLNKTTGDNKYGVKIKGVPVDVYDVLAAFNVTNPATAHAIKKQLKSGQRGQKDTVTDLREAIESLERAIELEQGDD